MATSAEESCRNEVCNAVQENARGTRSRLHTVHQQAPAAFVPVPPTAPARKQELLVPLLAFWKCHAIYPEAFQPVKLKQRCKAETLMKCINLEHRASLLITAWFVYEPSQKQKTERKEEEEEAEAALLRGRLCNGPYTHTYILSISASPPGCK